MDRAGLITLEQARAAGLSFDEPEPRACPHCGAALDPLGAALAGRVAWVSAAPCPCEGAASERESEARRRAALAAKEEAARREKALSRAGIPRRYWAAEADRPEFAEYIASFAGNGGAGLYIHGGVGAGKTHAASAMARLFAEAGYDVAFTTAKGMLERVKATFDEGGTEAAVARYAKWRRPRARRPQGKEDATEWLVRTVFSVLDARYEDMRPTIVTSNYAPGRACGQARQARRARNGRGDREQDLPDLQARLPGRKGQAPARLACALPVEARTARPSSTHRGRPQCPPQSKSLYTSWAAPTRRHARLLRLAPCPHREDAARQATNERRRAHGRLREDNRPRARRARGEVPGERLAQGRRLRLAGRPRSSRSTPTSSPARRASTGSARRWARATGPYARGSATATSRSSSR